MLRAGHAVEAAGRHGPGRHNVAELHHRHEAVAAGAVPLLGSGIGARAERGERSPPRRREAHRDAGAGVVEGLHDVAGEPLEAVDVAPRRVPLAEVGRQLVDGRGQRGQALLARGLRSQEVVHRHPPLASLGSHARPHVLAPEHRHRRGHRRHRPPVVPPAQGLHCIGQPGLERARRGQPIVVFQQQRQLHRQLRQVAVERGRNQRLLCKALLAVEHHDGVHAARVLRSCVHVGRVVLPLRAERARYRVGPVVGVLDPAVGRVEHVGTFVHRHQIAPLGGRVAAVHGPAPVERRVPLGNEVGMEVGDVALGVGKHGVVGRVGVQVHHLLVLGEVLRLGAAIGLRERLERLVHQPDGHPLAVGLADDGAVVGAVDGELLLRHARGGLVGHRDRARRHRPLLGAVLVEDAGVLLDDGLQVLVDVVDAAGGVHPAGLLVEALVDEELSPREGAVGVEALAAGHLRLVAEEERGVRVDPQHGLARGGVGPGHREAVGAGGLGGLGEVVGRRLRLGAAAVEGLELAQVHALDVAADAALAEGERHPRLEAGDHARLHLGARRQVVVEAAGPRVHQGLQPLRRLRVLRLHVGGVDEQLHPQVTVDLSLALGLGQPALRVEEVGLHPVEVVLGLGVHQPEHRVGVGLAGDVRDAPVVADDGDAGGALLPGGHLGRKRFGGRLRRARCGGNSQGENKDEFLHEAPFIGPTG